MTFIVSLGHLLATAFFKTFKSVKIIIVVITEVFCVCVKQTLLLASSQKHIKVKIREIDMKKSFIQGVFDRHMMHDHACNVYRFWLAIHSSNLNVQGRLGSCTNTLHLEKAKCHGCSGAVGESVLHIEETAYPLHTSTEISLGFREQRGTCETKMMSNEGPSCSEYQRQQTYRTSGTTQHWRVSDFFFPQDKVKNSNPGANTEIEQLLVLHRHDLQLNNSS